MPHRFSLPVALTTLLLSTLTAPLAWAQEEETEEADEQAEPEDSAESEPKRRKEREEPTTPPEEEYDPGSPEEEPGRTYYFVGLRYRPIVVPKFMMNMFGDGGRTVFVHAGGPEFGIRKDGFEYDFSLWFANYAMKNTPFKAKNDPDRAWEIVKSEIKVLYLTADFLWSHDFAPEFALNYGLGAGFGIVWGPLYRTQAYPPLDENGERVRDPYQYKKCREPFDPRDTTGRYCDDDNDHYDNYSEPSWANGGSKPNLFPWLALQTGFRFKPHRNFVARLDAGFGTSGFFFGLGADYGL